MQVKFLLVCNYYIHLSRCLISCYTNFIVILDCLSEIHVNKIAKFVHWLYLQCKLTSDMARFIM